MGTRRSYRGTLAKDLIRVTVGSVHYALGVSEIREIVNPLPVVELPRERAFVLGVADYRDDVVVVVDLRSFFGLAASEPTRRTKWIIIDRAGYLLAVIVDAVLDVFSSGDHQQRFVPELDDRHRARGITSAYKHADELVFLLDPARLAAPIMDLDPSEFPSLQPEAP